MKKLIILMMLIVSTTAIFEQTANQEKQKKEHKTKTAYSCSMHPEVTSNKPGKCSKCGTQLVVNRIGSKQSSGVTHTCSMHPDFTSETAGTCSKHGMARVEKKEKMINSEAEKALSFEWQHKSATL